MRIGALLILTALALPSSLLASNVEKLRNPKVVVNESTLARGESQSLLADKPTMLVFMAAGTARIQSQGKSSVHAVKEGQVIFQPAGPGSVRNDGASPLHFTEIEFLTAGSSDTWGMTGLPPNYAMLLENRFARAYDIKIPAHGSEPQHTHHERVVISLSGAHLEHILPDGTHQPSDLKTGEIAYRPAATHIGHNLGDTPLWVIAVEPK